MQQRGTWVITIMKISGSKPQDEGRIEQDFAVGSTYVPDLNDKAMERRVVRKIDRWILPFICISYLINFLDRVRITRPRHATPLTHHR